MKDILHFPSIQKFIEEVGENVKRYFVKDPGVIVCLRPDGLFYGEGLHQWLQKQKSKADITITTMEDNGEGLAEEKVRGRKVLVVDNDIITGKGYKSSMDALRMRKNDLQIKEIKFATYIDRPGLADFSVMRYSPEAIWEVHDFDAIDQKLIALLSQDGRMSLTDLAAKVRLSSVAVKHRVDALLENGFLRIQGMLNIKQFYTMSATILVALEPNHQDEFIEKFQKMQEVCHLAKRVGKYNLLFCFLAQNVETIGAFIENEVRNMPGVKELDVMVGEVPLVPQTIHPR